MGSTTQTKLYFDFKFQGEYLKTGKRLELNYTSDALLSLKQRENSKGH